MATITTKQIIHQKEWEDFLSLHEEANFLQSWYWGEFHKKLNNTIYRSGFFAGSKFVGVMLSIVEQAKRGRYLTVAGGPIIDWKNSDQVTVFVQEMKRIAEKEQCVFVRVRPQLIEDEFSTKLFKQLGFVDAPMHLTADLTSQLMLTISEERLLTNMRKTTRYEVKKAIAQGVVVSTSDDPESIERFYALQLETAKRQNFVPFSYQFLHEQFSTFAQEGKALLFTARFDKEVLAQAFILFYGKEAVYHYGASTELGRKYPGAYLIQWEAIKEAKRRGINRYNLWGVANDSNHRFYNISIFKRGFGGVDVQYLHAQDLVINNTKYLLNLAVERVRKQMRNL